MFNIDNANIRILEEDINLKSFEYPGRNDARPNALILGSNKNGQLVGAVNFNYCQDKKYQNELEKIDNNIDDILSRTSGSNKRLKDRYDELVKIAPKIMRDCYRTYRIRFIRDIGDIEYKLGDDTLEPIDISQNAIDNIIKNIDQLDYDQIKALGDDLGLDPDFVNRIKIDELRSKNYIQLINKSAKEITDYILLNADRDGWINDEFALLIDAVASDDINKFRDVKELLGEQYQKFVSELNDEDADRIIIYENVDSIAQYIEELDDNRISNDLPNILSRLDDDKLSELIKILGDKFIDYIELFSPIDIDKVLSRMKDISASEDEDIESPTEKDIEKIEARDKFWELYQKNTMQLEIADPAIMDSLIAKVDENPVGALSELKQLLDEIIDTKEDEDISVDDLEADEVNQGIFDDDIGPEELGLDYDIDLDEIFGGDEETYEEGTLTNKLNDILKE